MTFLQLVNDVLARLRESSVATVTATDYSSLIGKFVNDAKRQVEDSWDWDALSTSVTVNTVSGTSNYVVTGSGRRQKSVTVNNTTSGNKNRLVNCPVQWIRDQQDLSTISPGIPSHFAWNGSDGTDSKAEIYPTPNGVFALKFHMVVPQVDLSADGDILSVPSDAVIMGAYARALVERGEDGGLSSSEAYQIFKRILGDQISIEASRYMENDCFVAR